MDRAIGRAWLTRISVLNTIRLKREWRARRNAEYGLRRFLIGEECLNLTEDCFISNTVVSDFAQRCGLMYNRMFMEPVQFMLSSIYPVNTHFRNVKRSWNCVHWNSERALDEAMRIG